MQPTQRPQQLRIPQAFGVEELAGFEIGKLNRCDFEADEFFADDREGGNGFDVGKLFVGAVGGEAEHEDSICISITETELLGAIPGLVASVDPGVVAAMQGGACEVEVTGKEESCGVNDY